MSAKLNSKKISKQTALGNFGFTKIVTKKDGSTKLCDISIVQEEEKKETCQHCDLSFGNAGALSTHFKCKHGTVPVISKPDNALIQVSTPGPSEESLLGNDNQHTQVETTSSTSNVTKRKKKEKYAHLKKKRLSYPAKFKVQVIKDREKGMKPCELVEKYSDFRPEEPKISRWMKQKDSILKEAASEHKNLMKIFPSIYTINCLIT